MLNDLLENHDERTGQVLIQLWFLFDHFDEVIERSSHDCRHSVTQSSLHQLINIVDQIRVDFPELVKHHHSLLSDVIIGMCEHADDLVHDSSHDRFVGQLRNRLQGW